MNISLERHLFSKRRSSPRRDVGRDVLWGAERCMHTRIATSHQRTHFLPQSPVRVPAPPGPQTIAFFLWLHFILPNRGDELQFSVLATIKVSQGLGRMMMGDNPKRCWQCGEQWGEQSHPGVLHPHPHRCTELPDGHGSPFSHALSPSPPQPMPTWTHTVSTHLKIARAQVKSIKDSSTSPSGEGTGSWAA